MEPLSNDDYPIRRLPGVPQPSRYVWRSLKSWCAARKAPADTYDRRFFRIANWLTREDRWSWALEHGWQAADDAAPRDARDETKPTPMADVDLPDYSPYGDTPWSH
jgi:hypothetical protein